MSALERALQDLHEGPIAARSASNTGIRLAARRAALRFMRPFIVYQSRVNVDFSDVLREHQRSIEAATVTEAHLMAEVRRLQRRLDLLEAREEPGYSDRRDGV